MSSSNSHELVTIGQAVTILAREYPDVTISSLRFLEREGLLSPQRKPGGHRLYSANDINRARRIKKLQADRIPLKEIRDRLQRAPGEEEIEDVVDEMTSHLFNHDIPAALAVLIGVYESGMPLMAISNDVLTPVLRNLGDDKGNHLIPVDVQLELDEHLMAFFSRIASPPGQDSDGPVVVAACPPWERHDMPLRMLAAILDERGARVHFIGAQVDREFVTDAMTRVNPRYILVSLTVKPPSSSRVWFGEIIEAMTLDQRLVIGGIGSVSLPAFDDQRVENLGMFSYAEVVDRLMDEPESTTG